MKFTAVVTVHDADPTKIITNLLTQTRRPDEILVYMSDVPAQSYSGLEDAPTFEFFVVPNRDDWGHEKRAMGLDRASGEYIGWFNHDDEYEPTYVETMMRAVSLGDGADIAFCNWTFTQRDRSTVGNCEFRGGNSTAGNWIGRTALVREAGYTDRHYGSDSTLIARINELIPRVVKINDVLYHHNP